MIPDRRTVNEGMEGFRANLSNPYDYYNDFEEYREWERGWNYAYYSALGLNLMREALRK